MRTSALSLAARSLVALVASAGLAACGSNGDTNGNDAAAGDAGRCASPVYGLANADGGAACSTCLERGCSAALTAYLDSSPAACTKAAAALADCAATTCGPACGGSFGETTIDAGTTFSPTCQTYVSCCVAANSAALLDAGITLASIVLSCDQNASVSSDAECATLTAEFLDAGIVCH